jgi:hypothetical protein
VNCATANWDESSTTAHAMKNALHSPDVAMAEARQARIVIKSSPRQQPALMMLPNSFCLSTVQTALANSRDWLPSASSPGLRPGLFVADFADRLSKITGSLQ